MAPRPDRAYQSDAAAESDPLGELEQQFISHRDSFLIASINEDGWPYLQHRGGPAGFLHVLDEHTLACADFRSTSRCFCDRGCARRNHRAATERIELLEQQLATADRS